MTTVYVPSILLAFSLPGSVWLGWLPWEARQELDEAIERGDLWCERYDRAAWQSEARWTARCDAESDLDAALAELAMTRLVRDVFAQQLADTFPMPTVHGHDAEITSPGASVEPSPIHDETVRYFASLRLASIR